MEISSINFGTRDAHETTTSVEFDGNTIATTFVNRDQMLSYSPRDVDGCDRLGQPRTLYGRHQNIVLKNSAIDATEEDDLGSFDGNCERICRESCERILEVNNNLEANLVACSTICNGMNNDNYNQSSESLKLIHSYSTYASNSALGELMEVKLETFVPVADCVGSSNPSEGSTDSVIVIAEVSSTHLDDREGMPSNVDGVSPMPSKSFPDSLSLSTTLDECYSTVPVAAVKIHQESVRSRNLESDQLRELDSNLDTNNNRSEDSASPYAFESGSGHLDSIGQPRASRRKIRSSQRSKFKAAISADSRQYNVFTFLGDDATAANSDDEGDDGDGSNVLPVNDDYKASSSTATSSYPVSPSDSSTVLSSSVDEGHKSEGGEAEVERQLSQLKVTNEDDMPDLDLPTIEPLSADGDDADFPKIKRKIIPSTPFDLDVTLSPASSLPDLYEFDGRRTLDDLDDSELHDIDDAVLSEEMFSNSVFGPHLDWEDSADSLPIESIPEYTAREELEDNKRWRVVQLGDKSYRIDMEAIDPYKKVLSHGGYYGDGLNAIIVFTACHLPDKTGKDYHYIMDNLFLYVMSTLELLVVQDYMIVYFHSASSRRKLPGLRWFKRCYDMIDRRLRKNLQGLLVVHPTLFLKTVMVMLKPFVSSKFSAKMRYVNSLAELTRHVPTEYMFIPDEVIQDDRLMNPSTPIPPKKFVNF